MRDVARTISDPQTGRAVRDVARTISDPQTGRAVRDVLRTISDPQTGRAVRDVARTISDPQTGRAIGDTVANFRAVMPPIVAFLELGQARRRSPTPSANDVPGWVIEGDAGLSMAWPEDNL